MTLLSSAFILKSFKKLPELEEIQKPLTLFLEALDRSPLSQKEKRTQRGLILEIVLCADPTALEPLLLLFEQNFEDPSFFQRQCDRVSEWRRTCSRFPRSLRERSKRLGILHE